MGAWQQRWRRWLFLDAGAIIRAGRARPLVAADAPPLDPELDPRASSDAFDRLDYDRFWPLCLRLFFTTGASARALVVITVARLAIVLATPVLLHAVLERLPGAQGAASFPFALASFAVLLGLAGIASALLSPHWFHKSLRVRSIIINAVNRRVVTHALRLSRTARGRMGTGDMVNHLGSDADALAEVGFFLPEGLNAALTLSASFVALSLLLGWGALASLLALVLIAPLTFTLGARFRKLEDRAMAIRDERTNLMSQVLHGIRAVKYHAWEPSLRAEVQTVRRRELRERFAIVATDVVSSAFWVSTSTLVAFAGLGAHVLLGGALDAPLVFSSLALFAMLEDPFGMIPHITARYAHAKAAAGRLRRYFAAAERPEDVRELSPPGQAIALRAEDVSVHHDGAATPALQTASLAVAAGEAVAIVGPVGAGKSTLLRALAGLELPSAGRVHYGTALRPRIAYVPQEAFILNASLRDNILFGDGGAGAGDDALAPIIADCALGPDLSALPAGLDTEIGERGVNLSGGQKQRVALARAAHHRPGVVLLDDPLSAVDVHTEQLLVQRLLLGRWRGLTRIVVTHRLAHLARFDRVLLLTGGRIAAQGTYAELMQSSAEFRAFAQASEQAGVALAASAANETDVPAAGEARARDGHFIEDEDRETGAVRGVVYHDYVRAMVGSRAWLAPALLCALIATAAAVAVLPMLQRVWLARFTDRVVEASPLAAVGVYGAVGLCALVAALVQKFVWLYRATDAARIMHDRALDGVLGAPLRFFDSTPTGRILNRFARDLDTVDDELPWNFEQACRQTLQTLAAFALIVAVIPALLLVALPVLVLYHRLQQDYRTAAREAKRLEAIARSPRYAHFKELVTGLDVIHGFGRERFFLDGFYAILTHYQRLHWCSVLLNRWFGVRVPLLSGLLVLATSVGVVLAARAGALGSGTAGLVLTYSLSLWTTLNWTVRATSLVEACMTSAERLQHYARLPGEPITTARPLPDDAPWPTRGAIEFRDLCTRYAPHLPRVLDGVSFSVEGGSKLGIVGRTGAGKTTLMQALFRFIEPERGAIFVDGVDLGSVPLPRLRRAIAIIPQDPTLFAGTVRGNLDRFGACSDEQLWTALRRVRLDALVRELPGQLDAAVAEHGHNFSQGQRQLLCMGRAILIGARIVVLDEATSSVDLQTDRMIQHTVRTELQGVTVLVIAHRLETVAQADQVVELGGGKVVRPAVEVA
jgi:ABC-type multidrug transport system fused ATPase/permease subunit